MNMSKLRIVIDERERKSGIPKLLQGIGLDAEIKTILVGDYIVAPETVVERKSIKDLISSIFDGRLFDQCARLCKHYKNPLMIIEGNIDEIEKITENPLIFYGALATIAIEFKIPIIPTPSAAHTAKLLLSMCARKDQEQTGPYIKKIKKSIDVPTQQISLIASLPGVGPKIAAKLLERFGTPLEVMNASQSELARIDGLGSTRARKIRSMIGTKSTRHKKTGQKKLS
ncbi:MAG: ERCC4 domain protein [Cenarchaeum symbiont of Oopsacas minuta]|nr:ERCC4 domain protein [Cenarchaeum symbiont of Oopsacas minuta]